MVINYVLKVYFNLFLYLLFELCDFRVNVSKWNQCILNKSKVTMAFKSDINGNLVMNI